MLTPLSRFRSRLLLAVATAAALHAPLLAATPSLWNGTTGNWSDPTKWSTNPAFPNNSGPTQYDVTINAGAVSLDVSPTIQALNFNNATINGPGSLALNSTLSWSNASFSAGASVTANAGISMGTTNNYLAGSSLTNVAGQTATLANSNLHFQLSGTSPSFFINNGLFNATGPNGNLYNDSGSANAFINNGTLTSSVSANFQIFANFVNNGTFNLASGTTFISGNESASSGTFIIPLATTLNLNAGNHNFLPASLLTGAGNATFSTSGTTTLSPSYNITGTTTLANGYLNTSSPTSIPGLLSFAAGDIVGNVTASAGISVISQNAYLTGGTLTNASGQTTTLNNSNFHLQAGGAGSLLINNGSFNATGSTGNIFNDSGTANTVINNALLTSSVSGNFQIIPTFVNNGTLSIASGTTFISGNETASTGSYLVAAGATLNFNSANHSFLPASSFSGPGNVTFSTAGTSTLSPSYNITGTTTLANGYLNTSSPTSIPGLLSFASGAITGNITANAGISVINQNAYLTGGTLTNASSSTATLSTSSFHLQINGPTPSSLINNGTFNVIGSAGNIFNDSGTANLFTNNALLTSSVSGTFQIITPFLNNGTLSVTNGTTLVSGNEAGSAGAFLVSAGATLNFNSGNHTFLPASSFSGPGNVSFSTGGTSTLSPNYNVTGTTTVAFGFLATSAPLTIPGLLAFTSGAIAGNVTAAGGISVVNQNAYISGGILTNASSSTATLSSSSFHFQLLNGSSGSFINNGTFSAIGSAANLFVDSGTANLFTNNSLVTSSLSGTFQINVPFLNNGFFSASAGTVLFNANGSHSGFFTGAGTFNFAGIEHFNSGALVSAQNVTFSGTSTFHPGSSLNTSNNLSITPGGRLNLSNATTYSFNPIPVIAHAGSGSNSSYTATLDLDNSSLIVQATDATDKAAKAPALGAALRQARNGGNWLGTGITSSLVIADSSPTGSHNTTLSLFDNAELPGGGLPSFNGIPLTANSLLITRATIGDANLDHNVDLGDYDIWYKNVGNPGLSTSRGDFNMDNNIDLADYDAWYQHVGASFALSPQSSSLTPSPVPEPTSLALLAATTLPLLLTRRRL